MIKLGKDLELNPIKLENKEGTDKLKAIHCKINDILFYWTYRNVSPLDAKEIMNDLIILGEELRDLDVPERAQAKKNELLARLRTVVTPVKDFTKETLIPEDGNTVVATIKKAIAQFLTAKEKNTLSDDAIISTLKETKRIANNQCKPINIPTDKLTRIQDECIQILSNRYKI